MIISRSLRGSGASVRVFLSRSFTLTRAREAAWLAGLPAARRTVLEARADARSRHDSLLATRLLQCALAAVALPTSLASLSFDAGGAPSLDLPIDFSLSHGGGLVGCALSTIGAVGLDLEAVGLDHADAFARYLNDAERAWAGASARRFATIWTRKEAVAKAARSSGLRCLPGIDTSRAADVAWFDGVAWPVRALPVGRRCAGHVATRTVPERVELVRVARGELDALRAPAAPGTVL